MGHTGILADLRFALRGLLRAPAFSAATLLTLGLGIGATTAVFTLVDGVLIRPLPFQQPDRLVSIQHSGREGADELPTSLGLYVLYRERVATLEEVGLYASTTVNVVVDGEPDRVDAQVVTPGFMPMLGVQPARGRGFTEAEGAPQGEQVVILSDTYWRTRFGADPDVLNRTLDVNGTLRTVVGVMPPDFGFPDRNARMWLPLVVDPAQAPLAAFGPSAVGRLAPGATVPALATELESTVARLAEFFPEDGAPAFLQEVGLRALAFPLKEALVGDVSTTLWILLGTVGFVLLIACANVANLLLVRAEGRQRELAVRVAIGAGRVHLLRWFLAESFVLAGAGAILGVLIAAVAVRASLGVVPADIPRLAEIGVDVRVVGFTAAVALVCAVFFGLFPWFRMGASTLAAQLRDGSGRGATVGRERHRVRNGLVVTQVALALVLLVGAGLMARSFGALRAVHPGFDADSVLTARITVPSAEIEGWEQTTAFFRQLGQRLEAQPGVSAVGFTQALPLTGGYPLQTMEVEDHPRGPTELPIIAYHLNLEPGYLETMAIPLVEGRALEQGDGAEGARSVMVSRAFAERWWPGASPLGRKLRRGIPDEDWFQVVGVVEDVRYESLEGAPEEMVYWPTTGGSAAAPFPTRAMDVVIRTSGDPLAQVNVLRREVRELNPRIPVSNPRTVSSILGDATARVSFTMALLAAASAIALVLGIVGIYGVISYIVSQRTREIGVRMALGASASSVQGMVVRQGMVLAGLGVGLGLVASAALSSVMGSILFGVNALDPVTYALVAGALLTVAVGASWVPARRAAAVAPSTALRQE